MTTYYICVCHNVIKSVKTNNLFTDCLDSAITYIKNQSKGWILDEIGKNNYNETLIDNESSMTHTADSVATDTKLPNGIVRVWSPTEKYHTISIYNKKQIPGVLYGSTSTSTLLRQYVIESVEDVSIQTTIDRVVTERVNKLKEVWQLEKPQYVSKIKEPSTKTVSYDTVIDEIKLFNMGSLTPVQNSPRGKENVTPLEVTPSDVTLEEMIEAARLKKIEENAFNNAMIELVVKKYQ